MSYGKVYLVGAGPGDAELITVKGQRLIAQADVILHDHLIPHELLTSAKAAAEIISVGKLAGRHTLPQPEINDLIVEKAKAPGNRIVVRLKGGDPLIFGRGGEEAIACRQAGVEFEFVPGITSALAVPCYGGIPPTHRDFTSNVAIVTGRRKEDKDVEIPKAGTIIFLMSVGNIRKIIAALLKAGWSEDDRIAAIQNGTRYNQKVVTGTLRDFPETIEKASLGTPAIFIVGKVVELCEQLGWFAAKPRIFLPGTHPEKYAHLGTIIHRPLIRSVHLENYAEADEVFAQLQSFQWIVFTSTNGVKFFFDRLKANDLDTRALHGVNVAAIGATTAEALSRLGIRADMVPNLESSVGLLEEFAKKDMKGQHVLLVRPRVGASRLKDGLLEAGAVVDSVVVYRNIQIEPSDIDFEFVDQILFTSGSTVRAFIDHYGSVPKHVKVLCLGRPTLDTAEQHGIEADLLEPTSDPD